MIKERENLTPGYCNKLLSKDKKYFVVDANCPGLWLKVGAYLKDKNNNPRLDKRGFIFTLFTVKRKENNYYFTWPKTEY